MSEILVTGGAGAIGYNLVNALIDKGHSVTILDDLSSGYLCLLHPEARFVEGSIASDGDLKDAFATGPEYVIHLAALFANQNSVEHPLKDLEVNARGTMDVLHMAQQRGVSKVLYASSSCVYGAKKEMREEDAPGQLDTPYAITKWIGEPYCKFWSDFHDLDTVIIRLFNSYGPGEFPGKYRNVIPNFFDLAMRGQPLPITGDGTETRDFTYVGDTVEGLVSALFSTTKSGDVFNLATGRATEIIKIAQAINAVVGNKAGFEYKPRRKWDHIPHRLGIIDKAKKELGYNPQTLLEDGLERTYAWLRDNMQKMAA